MRRSLYEYEQQYVARVAAKLTPRASDEARLDVARYAENLLENDFPPLFDLDHLAYVTGTSPIWIQKMLSEPEDHYSSFRIPKRSGGSRVIQAPTPALKRVQHWIQRFITRRLWFHDACHGFRRGRSIVTNAMPHVGSPLIVKYDIRDFFGSVDRLAVFRLFRRIGYVHSVADALTRLTTLNESLPQGAPTSPDLANFAAYRLDVRLSSFAAHNGITYTRYADDLTFSGTAMEEPRARRLIEHVLRDEGFPPNQAKVRFLGRGTRQNVTGIVVNDKPNWPRPRRRWLRQEIYYLRKYGIDEHLAARGLDPSGYKEFLYGHVVALHAVRPDIAGSMLDDLDGIDWPY